jgi:hypothetical protein
MIYGRHYLHFTAEKMYGKLFGWNSYALYELYTVEMTYGLTNCARVFLLYDVIHSDGGSGGTHFP